MECNMPLEPRGDYDIDATLHPPPSTLHRGGLDDGSSMHILRRRSPIPPAGEPGRTLVSVSYTWLGYSCADRREDGARPQGSTPI